MKNYFEEFYNRYESLKSELGIEDLTALKPDALTSILKNALQETSDSKSIQTLNNLVMAGLGMGTLYLRMGAVLMIAEKTKEGAEQDVSFLKLIADKLIHKLPADGEWKDIWKAYLGKNNDSEWNKIVNASPKIPKYEDKKIVESFVSFRNNIVHQELIITSALNDSQIDETISGLRILDAMSKFRQIFKNCNISMENNEVYFQYSSKEEKLKISPYVQINKLNEPEKIGILPYLFQGRYYAGAKFINTEGAETKAQKDEAVDDTFEKIKSDISRFNGDKAFDFDEKIKHYNEWCIGRDNEVNAIVDWINNSETDKNVLPIYAPAGLGKGALVAELIKNLRENKNKHLFHFCGSGAANNLQAILYSLIIQGKENKYWNAQSLPEKFKNKLERLPSQYTDVIELFQALLLNSKTASKVKEIVISDLKQSIEEATYNNKKVKPLIGKYTQLVDYLIALEYHDNIELVSECLGLLSTSIQILRGNNEYQDSFYPKLFDLHCKLRDNNIENEILSFIEEKHQYNSDDFRSPLPKLIIIIDGLDEAAVADHSKRITDWFYTYDEKGERKYKWKSPDHTKWIFTYRQTAKENKEGFQFEYYEFKTYELPDVQPLKGLSKEAVKHGFLEEFKNLQPSLTEDFLDTIIKKGAVK
jgi:DNA-binding ferritin-like protein (Dps family)